MKKIVSKKHKERKENMKQWIVGIILIGVMLIGIIGGSFQGILGDKDSSKKIVYNGFEFLAQGDYWVLEKEAPKGVPPSTGNKDLSEEGKGNFIFSYNPKEVERIEGNLNLINNYYNKPLYIFSEDNNAEGEIYQNLFYYNQLVQRMQKACPEGENCEEDIPTKTCENNFIIIKESDLSKIYQQDNCVFVEGKKEDLLKVTDEFLFKILDIS